MSVSLEDEDDPKAVLEALGPLGNEAITTVADELRQLRGDFDATPPNSALGARRPLVASLHRPDHRP
jgi:hypothetical protein